MTRIKFLKTIDLIHGTRLTATCCDGRRRSSERRARGARTEDGRALTETAERLTRERSAAGRAGWLAAAMFRARVRRRVARCVLFVAPGGRAIVRAAASYCPPRGVFRAIVDQSAI